MPFSSPTSPAPLASPAFDAIARRHQPAACDLRTELAEKLHGFQEQAATNHLLSPVRNLALYISGLVQQGRLDLGGLADLVQLLSGNAFYYRARKLHDYIGETDRTQNDAFLKTLFEAETRDADGNLLAFETFAARFDRALIGIVITAHPTFSVSKEMATALAQLATGTDEASAEMTAAMEMALDQPHGSAKAVTLDDELDFALMAIGNIRVALRRAYGILFDVARAAYPDDWQTLTPRLLTVASWVGYDLDGRSDIGWSETLKKRMTVERHALDDYLAVLDGITGMDAIAGRLKDTATFLDADLTRLADGDSDVDLVGAFSRGLIDSLDTRLTDIAWAVDQLTAAIEADHEQVSELAVLRAEMACYGLAFAHTHVRINATQIGNAIRHDIDMTSSPEDPANRHRYLREITELLDAVEPQSINFGSIMRERTSAKRMVMLVTQFLKYVDGGEPVRFLIAECNTAFTVLSALYFAKLFGVDDKIDISPLFETSFALEQGDKIVSELLKNPHYVDYVRGRGRLCIQTGFSDAGRYIGQIPASLAIERIRIKLAKLLERKGMGDVELVIFDTHGESIGRGAHPRSFADRLKYTYPDHARDVFRTAGVRVKQEVSFQGGDGYVYFADPDMAFATICRLVEHGMDTSRTDAPDTVQGDLFYEDSDYALDFFNSVKGFNERLMENRDYAVTLDLFGTNLLYPSGSRKVKRQHEGGGKVDLAHPSQVRAIPHNAVLQQLGYMSNSISGLGKAIAKDSERFEEMYEGSDRMRRFMSLAAYARHLSTLDTLHGYISLFDPTIWIRRITVEKNPDRMEQMQHLAHILRHSRSHEKMNRVYRIFLNDTIYLDRALNKINATEFLPQGAEHAYPDLTLLHGVRIALIHELFLLVARLPKFTNLAQSSEDIINELLHLDVDHALSVLRQGFPISEPAAAEKEFGEPATYRTDVEQGYEREHRELFDPIERIYDVIRRTGTGITHVMGAVG